MNRAENSDKGAGDQPDDGWLSHVAAWLGLPEKWTRWFLVVVVLAVVLFLGVVGASATLDEQVARVAIRWAVVVIVILMAFALIAHFRSSRMARSPGSLRDTLEITTGDSHVKWRHEGSRGRGSASIPDRPADQDVLPKVAVDSKESVRNHRGAPVAERNFRTVAGHLEPTVKGMVLKSGDEFLRRLRGATGAVFINIQVTLSEWFDPWTQVHLALQDSAYRSAEVRTVVTDGPGSTCPVRTPFRRILVTSDSWDELRDKIYAKNYPEFNVVPLALIHCCMGCPLALVTPGPFVKRILRPNYDTFFNNQLVQNSIGLDSETLDRLMGESTNVAQLLEKPFEEMQMQTGVFRPSMDCAVLYFEGAGNAEPEAEVWKAALTQEGDVYYFRFDSDGIVGLSEMKIEMHGMGAVDIASAYCRSCAEILDAAVWEETGVTAVRGLEGAFSPVVNALRTGATQVPVTTFLHAKEEFDLFALLRQSGVEL